jgi:hypothetical protein
MIASRRFFGFGMPIVEVLLASSLKVASEGMKGADEFLNLCCIEISQSISYVLKVV